MLTIIIFILILGVLVFVHEAGHFFVARWNGIKTKEFGLGFPPRCVGVQFLYEDAERKVKYGKKPFRIIWGSHDGDDEEEKKDLKEIYKKDLYGGTVYSLNWFPIGGFVNIKGEDGSDKKDEDSFASKSALARVSVLIAGVFMNFVFAWLLLSITFMAGSYQDVTGMNTSGAKVIVESVEDNSPAQKMGLRMGDQLIGSTAGVSFYSVSDVQNYINANRGKEIALIVVRENKNFQVTGVPRQETLEGQGALGISNIGEVVLKKYGFLESIKMGLLEIFGIMMSMVEVLRRILMGQNEGLTVTGFVGIASYTGQIIPLGLGFILRFAAILSINLGFVNILPIPALDGGRVLFVLIEKIKGSPVNQKMEQWFHTTGFIFLLSLMVVVTYFDLARINIFEKIKGIF